MKNKGTKLLFLLSISSGGVFSQTSNFGVLHVSSNTVISTVSKLENNNAATIINDGEFFIYDDVNNDGLFSFTPSEQGYTRFQGSSTQQISGSNNIELYDVLLDNNQVQNGFELSTGMKIANNADFTNGILVTDGFGGTVEFLQGATAQNMSNQSFVDGNVLKTGNDDFIFPIGDNAYYRRARVSSPVASTDGFSGHYFYNSPNPLYPIANKAADIAVVDDQEYWSIQRTNGNSMVVVTLSYDELTTTPQSVMPTPGNELHVLRWDVATSQWVDEGGTQNAITKTVSTPVTIDEFGIFTLGLVNTTPDVVISEGVTPNEDGSNETWIIDGLEKYPKSKVTIFNRWGTMVYTDDDYQNDWSGISESAYNIGGNELPEGTYFYILELGGTPGAYNYGKVLKGYFYLKRN